MASDYRRGRLWCWDTLRPLKIRFLLRQELSASPLPAKLSKTNKWCFLKENMTVERGKKYIKLSPSCRVTIITFLSIKQSFFFAESSMLKIITFLGVLIGIVASISLTNQRTTQRETLASRNPLGSPLTDPWPNNQSSKTTCHATY